MTLTMLIIRSAMAASVLLSGGCTVLGGLTGGVTGIADCTFWKVTTVGPVGLLWIPVAPFEGAYRGAQLGWAADKALLANIPSPITLTGHVLPCSANAMQERWRGKSLTWSE